MDLSRNEEAREKFIGSTIESWEEKNDTFIVKTDRGTFTFHNDADCCASSYFSDLELCSLPATVVSIDDGEYSDGCPCDPKRYCDVHDIEFVKIRTSKGYIDFTLHTEHNGYYGGYYWITHND